MRVGIALGSNLGDRIAHLRAAVTAIRAFAEAPILVSRVYETAPVNCPPGSPSFLNAAMEIGYLGELPDLLERLRSIEQANERPPDHGQNTPRTVDLDILYADDFISNEPRLTVPHPRLMDRLFVLLPLCDFAPDRRIPRCAETVSERARKLQQDNVNTYNIAYLTL
ncbi:MAG: 2-amino-4-hydroxy-6-hydroxymethyldihydropteridine diphosphokinase [Terrimicrobiaceae bacterium]|nr:2-amino-4-hydroxy-6-hydroxymethyldihydropteridine diphosphokinase [Terrimicrobiaceae bacterium]